MEPALKQRLVGAAVLIALAVIFLPMLIQGPAPESGVSDVPMQVPDDASGAMETRELPLVTPATPRAGGAVGQQPARPDAVGSVPTVDSTGDRGHTGGDMFPPPSADGDLAVSFGSYASAAEARRVVDALRNSQLPGYHEPASGAGDRTVHRVRIGPYDSRARAEAARLRAAHVHDDVGSRVVILATGSSATGSRLGTTSEPADPDVDAAAAPALDAETSAAGRPAVDDDGARVATAAEPDDETSRPAPPPERAAADVGFAVQLGAFGNAAEAGRLRDRARAAGYDAFVEALTTDDGPLTRVLAGPVADRAEAERMKSRLDPQLGVEGLVRSYP